MERRPVQSSSLRSIGYDPEGQQLEVEFLSGRIYLYREVPESLYAWLMRSPGKGGYFNRMIRDAYPFRDITPGPEQSDLAAMLQRSLEKPDR